jgi:hypothetical protein
LGGPLHSPGRDPDDALEGAREGGLGAIAEPARGERALRARQCAHDHGLPRAANTALDRVEPAGAGAERAWSDFFASWTRGNHVRTITAFAAVAALTVALVV